MAAHRQQWMLFWLPLSGAGEPIIVIDIDIEAVGTNQCPCLMYNLILNPSKAASLSPFCRGSREWGTHWRGKRLIMVGMFVSFVFC